MAGVVLGLAACGGKSAQLPQPPLGVGGDEGEAVGGGAGGAGVGGVDAGGSGVAGGSCTELLDSGTEVYVQPPEGGQALLELHVQLVPGGEGRDLRTVWALEADDVYAAGDGLLHWNGCAWSVLQEGDFAAMWFDGVQGWLGGKQNDCVGACPGRVLYRAGTRWSELPTLAGAVTSLWAAGPEELWATILEPSPSPDLPPYPAVVRWDGSVWTRLRGGNPGGGYAVVGYDATNVFVGRPQGVERWDGNQLSSAFSGTDCAPGSGISGAALWLGGCRILNGELSEPGFRGRWGMTQSDVWSVDINGNVSRFNGTSRMDVDGGANTALRAVSGASPDDVWVVGDGGAILHFAP
jgi:hypothetical protein